MGIGLMCIAILAFGKPKPMHKFILERLGDHEFIDFMIVTDNPADWRALLPTGSRNVTVEAISIGEWFTKSAMALGYKAAADLLSVYRNENFTDLNGWTACSMRPLIPLIFPEISKYQLWGWMDYDVVLSPIFTDYATECARNNIEMFPVSNVTWNNFGNSLFWEHIKVFHRKDIPGIFIAEMRAKALNDYQWTYEGAFTTFSATKYNLRLDSLPQDKLAVHWLYHRKIAGNNIPESHVNVYYGRGRGIYNADTGGGLLFFIADDEVRQFSKSVTESIMQANEVIFTYSPATQTVAPIII